MRVLFASGEAAAPPALDAATATDVAGSAEDVDVPESSFTDSSERRPAAAAASPSSSSSERGGRENGMPREPMSMDVCVASLLGVHDGGSVDAWGITACPHTKRHRRIVNACCAYIHSQLHWNS